MAAGVFAAAVQAQPLAVELVAVVQALALRPVAAVLAAAPVGADRASVCCSWHQYVGRATLK
jgi:hypothetical protein